MAEPDPPNSLDAEQALLGVLLYDPSTFVALSGLSSLHFMEPTHGRLFDVISERMRSGRGAEPIAIHQAMSGDRGLEELGGVRYIADLVDRAPLSANITSYAEVILSTWAARSLLAASTAAAKAILGGMPSDEVIGRMREELSRVEGASSIDESWIVDGKTATDTVILELEEEKRSGKPRGLRCGLDCIDRRMGGIKPGKLIVLGARPSMGKTALARNILYGAAKANPDDIVGMLTVEMLKRELIERQLSAQSWMHGDGVSYQNIGDGKLTEWQLLQLRDLNEYTPKGLIIKDHPRMSLDSVRRDAHALKRQGNLILLGIDYLQLMDLPHGDGDQNSAARWGLITKGLKQLSLDLNICILLLSQLSRQVEARDDKRPQLNDLRESGNIEQDADAVLLLYREHYYLQRAEPTDLAKRPAWEQRCALVERRLDVISGKVRGGAVGVDQQVYFPEYDHVTNRG